MLPRTRSLLKALLQRRRMEDDMRRELASHMERYVEDLTAAGVPIEEAKRRARLEFGPVDAIKEECRESVGLRWPLEAARDLRYSARALRRSPSFTSGVVMTLALCIGANTAIYSVVDWVLLRPLPYPQPERLAAISTMYRARGTIEEDFAVSGGALELLRSVAALEVGAYGMRGGANLSTGSQPEYVQAQRVTSGYFHVLGVAPEIGREFSSAEDRAGGPAAVVLSYGLWNGLLHRDRGVVGRTLQVRGEPCTIVGIMPRSFQPLEKADLWLPLRPSIEGEGEGPNYRVAARVRPRAKWVEADAQVHQAGASLLSRLKLEPGQSLEMRAVPLKREVMEDVRAPLLVLWAAVVVVLLIGCVNIAGVLLVRGAARRREIGTRMALGSGRIAVARQLLSEAVLLGVLGGAAGLLLGNWALQALKVLAGEHLDLSGIALDVRVVLITACASIVTGVLFGLAPALQASGMNIRGALLEGGIRGVAGGAHRWGRRALVITEVALGMGLLVVAGLLIRTFSYARGLDAGFDARRVWTATVSLEDARYRSASAVNRLYDETCRRMRSVPGIDAAGAALTLPYERALNMGFKYVGGRHAADQFHMTNLTYVTPGYIEALRIRVLRGRTFTAADNAGSRPVAIVNQAFVQKYLDSGEAVGRHIATAGTSREIVGVVGNVQLSDSFGNFSRISTAPGILIPAAQTNDKQLRLLHTWFKPSWIIRVKADSGVTADTIAREIGGVDPQLPLAGIRRMDQVIDESLADQRFQAILLAALAGLAVLLAALGIYGLIANTVVERTRELGIRLALGATMWQALRTVTLPGIGLTLAGVAAGLGVARACSSVLKHLIYGVRETDPASYAIAAVVLVGAALIACIVASLRLRGLNPADTLRAE